MLLEMAIGDAYGIGFEFCKTNSVNDLSRFYQHPKYSNLIPGQYTDDTQRSLANVMVITRKDYLNQFDYAQAYIDEFKASPRDGYSRRFQALIESCNNGLDLLSNVRPTKDSNGSIMGVAPVGYLEKISDVKRAAAIQAMVTHSYSTVPYAQMIALAAHYFLYDLGSKDDLLEFINDQLDEQYFIVDGRHPLKNTFSDIFKESEYEDIIEACDMTAQKTAYHSLYAVLSYDNLADMLKHCIDVGGDTDSLAALSMAIGSSSKEIENNLPKHLYDTLENGTRGRDYIDSLDNVLNNVYFPNTWKARQTKK
ncbi:MAG: ADP-ribosylglycohydrolase family protein [Gammaproteobacteria bacterium]|nr:ADP-ribosylglycohydrolase family protein [Gammaproteobacteria bacterium]